MGKLTTVQLEMVNSKCANGFTLDVDYFKATDELRFITDRIFDNIRYEYSIFYEHKYKPVGRKCKSVRPLQITNRYIILIKICKWKMSDSLDLWVNQGEQKVITSKDLTYDRKLLKHLQELTHQLDDEELESLTFD